MKGPTSGDPLRDVNDHRQEDYYDGTDLIPLGTPPSGTGGVRRVTRSIGDGACWCGETFGHAWPGKDSGAPHPESPNRPNTTAETGSR